MAYQSHFTAQAGSGRSKGGAGGGGKLQQGRVVKTVLSLSDPDCTDPSMLNGVFYRLAKVAGSETQTAGVLGKLSFARQGDASMRVIPMEGEMVEIYRGVSKNATGTDTVYWGKIINVWNHPHHNAVPDLKQENWSDRLLGGQAEKATVSPLQANPGDTLIEGRLGQSIRLGGYKGTQSKNIDDSNDGMPIVLISNGQIKTDVGDLPIEEDINEDHNSIHFLSNHTTTLKAANDKRDTYNEVPPGSDQYKGNQVLINGGRLYFNAKEESALISAKTSIGLNANTLNFDGKEYACIDADKIYIGKKARTSPQSGNQPVVLGRQLENWLGALLDTLDTVATAMSTATAVDAGPVTQLNAAGPSLKSTIQSLRTQYKTFQSKKVFTE